MRILVACEESQTVMKAFRAKGHDAWSCDIQDCSGDDPKHHIKADVLTVLDYDWDMVIAHPPCTYISNAGARWLYAGHELNSARYELGLKGKEFFMKFFNLNCPRICIENPVPSKIFGLPSPTQIIQPYWFGESWSKKTCLWLKGLPCLLPTKIVENHIPYCSSGSYSITHDPKYKGFSRKGGAAKIRSKTFQCVALAMAEQWG